MPQPADQNCGNCRFLIDTYKDGKPRCHRYPPQVKEEIMTSTFWLFPEVEKDDWCGEWRPVLASGNTPANAGE